MKRTLVSLALAAGLVGTGGIARAHDAYNDTDSNPLRIIAYGVNAVGWSLEWLVTRPIHFLVSQPSLEPVFGHTPSEDPFGNYPPYDPVHPVED